MRRVILPSQNRCISHAREFSTSSQPSQSPGAYPQFIYHFLEPKQISGVWLTASDRFITDRILCESNFYGVDKDAQYLITKFIARTLLYNRRLQENIRHLELEHIELKPNMTVEELIRECCDFLRSDLN